MGAFAEVGVCGDVIANATPRMAVHPHLARIGQTFGVCTIVLRQRRRAIRDNNRPHVERGQRRGNLPTPQAQQKKRKGRARVR